VVAEDRFVQFGHGDGPVVQRDAVEGAPLAVAHGLDLVGDDDVGVQVRVVGAGVVVVEPGRKDAGDLALHDRSTRSLGAGAGGDDLALDEVQCLLHGLVVGVSNDRLCPGIGDRPQDAGRLRDRERHVEPRHRPPALARLGLLVGAEAGAELLARDRVLSVPDESPEMLLGDLVADLEFTVEACDAGAEPVAGWGALLGVVARQRISQGPVPVARRDRAQQVVDPLAGVHRLDRDGHRDHLHSGGRCAGETLAAISGQPGTGDLGCKKRGRKSGGGGELDGQRAQGVRKQTMKR
jgi:hypothetical protein